MTGCRLGIVGLGSAGAVMLAAAVRHPRVQVTAVADPRIEALPVPAGIERYRSLQELLSAGAVDAVYIATPTALHDQHVRAALGEGRYVVVEKPVTADSEAGAALAALAEGALALVGHSESFEPYARLAAEAVRAGEVGTVSAVSSAKATEWMRRPRLPEEMDPAAGGGIVRRQGVHQIDVLRHVSATSSCRVLVALTEADPWRDAAGSYMAWLTLDEGVPALVAHDGTGRRVRARGPDAAPGPAADEPEAKRRRSGALLERLASGIPVRLGERDSGFLTVHGTDGDLLATPDGLRIQRWGEPEAWRSVEGMSDGRTAVLDELIGALNGLQPTHDLNWGVTNLRICEEMDAAASVYHSLRHRPVDPIAAALGPRLERKSPCV